MNTKTTVITEAALADQFACCDKIAAYWHDKDMTPTAYVETYGCQQNEADSETYRPDKHQRVSCKEKRKRTSLCL